MQERPVFVTGGCGFVGRHLVKVLLARGTKEIWILDDLSTGRNPSEWLEGWSAAKNENVTTYASKDRTITLVQRDAWQFLHDLALGTEKTTLPAFGDIFHLASIVGGRALIEGDPLMVAKDLGIDAAFFLWISRPATKVGRVLYASSSASYPIHMQDTSKGQALAESDINFDSGTIGVPDLTYGWSKLTGEFLAQLAHKKYRVKIATIRPFSGYGEDQDLTYPTSSIALRVARGDDPIEVWGTGEQSRDFVHIDDCVDAFFAILDHVEDGSGVNIGSGVATSFIELINRMLTLEKRTAKIKPLSEKPVGVGKRYADITYLSEKIGWKPSISLDDGLRRVLEGARARLAGRELPFSIV